MKKSKTKKPRLTLNTREHAVVTYVAAQGRNGAPLYEIAIRCFDRKIGSSVKAISYFRANSWARNAVRRPLRESLLRRIAEGTYAATAKGRRVLHQPPNPLKEKR